MRKSYNRVGISALILYGCMLVVTSVILGGLIGFFFGFTQMPKIAFSGEIDFEEIMTLLQNFLNSSLFSDILVLGSVLGAAFGEVIAILIIRKVLPKDRVEPERHRLSFGEFVIIALMAFGLWGVGVYLGNFPEFFGYGITTGFENADQRFMVIYTLFAVIGAPVIEELVFRKLFIDSTHKYGETVSVFVSALLFGLIHGNSAQFFLAFMLGLLFGTVYVRTGNVWLTIALHLMINLTASLGSVFGFLNIDIDWLMGYLILALMIAGLIVLFTNRKRDFLVLKRPFVSDANRQAFRNPGMIIAVIGGLLNIAYIDVVFVVNSLLAEWDFLSVIRLIPTTLIIGSVIALVTTVGHRYQKEEAPVSASSEEPIGESFNDPIDPPSADSGAAY